MKLLRKIPWILPDRPHLDHVWFDHGDRRGITFQDRWKPNLQLGFQVTLTAGYYQWLFTPRHKLSVLLDIGHHLIHLLHWVPRTRGIGDQELPAGSRSSLPLARTQSLPTNQAPKETWMLTLFYPNRGFRWQDVSFIGSQIFFFFLHFTILYIYIYVWNVWRAEKKQPVLLACGVEESNLGLYAWCQVLGHWIILKRQSFVAQADLKPLWAQAGFQFMILLPQQYWEQLYN